VVEEPWEIMVGAGVEEAPVGTEAEAEVAWLLAWTEEADPEGAADESEAEADAAED
jgi:hypothetical protein